MTIATTIAITNTTATQTRNDTMWNTKKMVFVGYTKDGMAIYREQKETDK